MPEVIVKVKDFPEKFREEMVRYFSHSMICLGYTKPEKKQLTPCGSGTLVRRDDVYGILTAAHVVNALRTKEHVVMFLQTGLGFIVFEKGTLDFRECAGANYAEDGPDIGFIGVPAARVGTINALKSFIDLDFQRSKLDKGAPELNGGVWCTTGFPYALGDQKMDGKILHTTVFGMVGFGGVEQYIEHGRFDYYLAGVELDIDESIPEDFGGMSGSGLWQVTIWQQGDDIVAVDKYLSGVAYFQTDIKDDVTFLKCHGRKSVYEYVMPELM